MDFGHWLSGAAGRRPERVAIAAGDEEVTYRELLLRAVRAAGALHLRGARPRRAGRAAARARAPVPRGAPRLPDPRRARGADRPAARRARAPGGAARGRDPRRAPDDGRDGRVPAARSGRARGRRARGAHLGHDRDAASRSRSRTATSAPNARGLAQAMDLGDDERWLCPLPLAARRRPDGLPALGDHGHDRRARAAAVRRRGRRPAAARRRHHDRLARARPSCRSCSTPGATPGPKLRRVLLGGGPMPHALLERARAAGFPVCPSYGLTQACSTVTVAEPGDLETAGHVAARRRRGDRRRRRDPRLRRHRQRARQPAHRRPRPDRRAGPPHRHRAARAT